MAKYFKIIFFLLLSSALLTAQNTDIKFEHISVEQGLSHTTVKSIFQDSKGFMWFGTEDGLNKFDGYKFIVYRYDTNDSTTLSFNEILSIYEDKSGDLWIATTGGGINRYDHQTDSFTRYTYEHNNPASVEPNSIYSMTGFCYGKKEILWLGTTGGLYKFDLQTEKFTHLPHTSKGWPYSWIRAVEVDIEGKVWAGAIADGLHRFDPATGQYTNFRHDPTKPGSLSNNGVISLCRDKSEILWVGTKNGLNSFQTGTDSFVSYSIGTNYRQAPDGNWIFSIREDRSGTLWLGTGAGGLKTFNRQTTRLTSYMHDPGDPGSISDNTVMCIFEDKAGLLWTGTWRGINIIDPRKTQFVDIKPHPGDANSLSGNFIWSLCESNYKGKSSLWIGTKTNGINKLNLTNGIIERFEHEPGNPNSIPSDFIFSLCEDRSGTLWIGTYGHGLIKYDPQLKKFYSYVHDPNNPGSISGNIIFHIIEDSNGNLWMGTQGGGLNLLDKKTNQFTCFLKKSVVTNIYEDRFKNLWLAGSGLRKLAHRTGEVISYRYNPQDPSGISSDRTTVIYETSKDGQQVLWVGTYSRGLNRFDTETEKSTCFTVDDGLPSNTINGILEDSEGNLWLSTNNGISKFNPHHGTFTNYDVSDGLLDNKFNVRVCCKTADGQMFFGSTKGLVAFYPDRLKNNHHVPEIVFTDFRIFNKQVGIKSNNLNLDNNDFLLKKHISQVREIELSYRENVFSFEFAALDYSAPDKNMYAYKMEGVDPDWVYTDASRRFATYTNLDPGEYTFRVKGSNNDGIWNEEGTSIKVIITPPWWKTNLAYILYFVIFISLVAATWRAQSRRLRIRQQLKMEHFEAEKLREVDQLKSCFFANISHEFRTPLTLIKGPVKQIMEGTFTGNLKQQCQMILRNSDRLLGLINQILDLSKLESGEISLQVAETDIVPYVKGILLSFSPLAETKNITLKFTSSADTVTGYADRDKLEKIVTNLLSNAFKFTPEGGEIEVSITPLPSVSPLINKGGIKGGSEEGVQIIVTNTGRGIPADQLDKIFDRFYQANDNYKKESAPLDNDEDAANTAVRQTYPTGEQGSGIGLALTKELVEVCRGEITVSSIPGKTTTFTVILPIARACFKDDEIVTPLIPPLSRGDKKGILETEKHPSGHPKAPKNKSTPLLLIVEDNPDVTTYISSFMNQDYRIITAENGKDGLKKVIDKYPDLVISDVMMPEMDGFELCQKIKTDERVSHIPIILLTAKADLGSKIEGLEFGADDYVTKPFEADELKMRSKNLIEQRKRLQKKFSQQTEIKTAEIAASSMDEKFLKRLLSVFEAHVDESDFSTTAFAQEVGMSRSNLHRKLVALTNKPAHEFMRTLRLKRAAQLLRQSTGSVSEIAYAVGFNNPSYFSKMFRQQYGQTPSEFANLNKQ